MRNAIANGLATGLWIGLLATAFSIAYVPTRAFHLALAAIYTLTPYLVGLAITRGTSPIAAGAIAIVLGAALSAACERWNHRRLRAARASDAGHLVASLGVAIAGLQLITIVFGPQPRDLAIGVSGMVSVFGAKLGTDRFITAWLSASALLLYLGWLAVSGLGIKLRALADNPSALALLGTNIDNLHTVAFALSGGIAAFASLLRAYETSYETVGSLETLLIAVAAAIVGGRDSFFGPLAGGLLFGLLANGVMFYGSAKWVTVTTFALLIVTLVLRPQGLLGRQSRVEANTAT